MSGLDHKLQLHACDLDHIMIVERRALCADRVAVLRGGYFDNNRFLGPDVRNKIAVGAFGNNYIAARAAHRGVGLDNVQRVPRFGSSEQLD